MNIESGCAGSTTSPSGRGRIAAAMQSIVGAIRVRGYSLSLDRNPSSQPSPIEVGYIRLRQFEMPNSGNLELVGRGSAPSLPQRHRKNLNEMDQTLVRRS